MLYGHVFLTGVSACKKVFVSFPQFSIVFVIFWGDVEMYPFLSVKKNVPILLVILLIRACFHLSPVGLSILAYHSLEGSIHEFTVTNRSFFFLLNFCRSKMYIQNEEQVWKTLSLFENKYFPSENCY